MSETFIVGPPENADWKLDPIGVATAFERDWPGVAISWHEDPKSHFAFDFELKMEHAPLEGRFDREGQALLIGDAWDEDLAELVVWFRRLVAPSQPLGVWSGSGRFGPLTPGMTASDFLRGFR